MRYQSTHQQGRSDKQRLNEQDSIIQQIIGRLYNSPLTLVSSQLLQFLSILQGLDVSVGNQWDGHTLSDLSERLHVDRLGALGRSAAVDSQERYPARLQRLTQVNRLSTYSTGLIIRALVIPALWLSEVVLGLNKLCIVYFR